MKSEIAGVKDTLKQLEFRVHDLENSLDRLDAGLDRVAAGLERLAARVDRIETTLRERRQSPADDDAPGER
jgi:septal ring factor EnvC (AmiA/AmiB activator)